MHGTGQEPFWRAGVLRRPQFNLEYQNRLREIRDLLFNPEQGGALIDEYAAVISDLGGGPSFVDADRAHLFSLVDTGFGQRRKMLRRSLASVVSAECFAAAGVAPEARPEELDLAAWARLTRCASNRPALHSSARPACRAEARRARRIPDNLVKERDN